MQDAVCINLEYSTAFKIGNRTLIKFAKIDNENNVSLLKFKLRN